MRYLQRGTTLFYAKRPDIFLGAQIIAKQLGGEVIPPTLPWKYAWIKKLFGIHAAERVRVLLPTARWDLVRFWDGLLYKIESIILLRNVWQDPALQTGSHRVGGSLDGPISTLPAPEASPEEAVITWQPRWAEVEQQAHPTTGRQNNTLPR